MDLTVVARLAKAATKDSDLDSTIAAASRGATPEQMKELKSIERENRFRLAICRHEGTPDFDGRVQEAIRVVEALYSIRNGKPSFASRTKQSFKRHGTVEALRRVIAKKDSPGLRILVENDRLDCAFEQIALDFPDIFREGDTLAIASETLERERGDRGGR
jgi:hypothetical protein